MELNTKIIKELDKIYLNASHLFILQQAQLENSLEDLKKSSLYLTLVRKNYLTLEGKITIDGKDLLSYLNIESDVKVLIAEKAVKKLDQFEQWWKNFPSTDRVYDEQGNIKFQETRSLRNGKPQCKIKYDKIISEGIYSHEDMVNALIYERELRNKQSLQENQNKMTFMSNSKTYLHNNMYESFMGMKSLDSSIKFTTYI